MSIDQRLRRTRGTVSAFAAGALAIGGMALTVAPAQAAPVFDELNLSQNLSMDHDSSCALTSQTIEIPDDKPLPDNGSATSIASGSQTLAPGEADPTALSGKASQTASMTARTASGNPLSLRFAVKSSASTTAVAGNTCSSQSAAESTSNFSFTTTKPLWVTFSHSTSGAFAGSFDLQKDELTWVAQSGMQLKGSGSTTWLLPKGHYQGGFQVTAEAPNTTQTHSVSGSASYSLAFAVPGSATAKPAGSALSYAPLASSRSCSAHTLTTAVTASSTRFKRISRVSWSVDGKTVKTLKGKSLKRGLKVKLRLSDTKKASVKATVRLTSGKSLTAKAAYRACS